MADGDPASDFLLTQRIFFYSTSTSAKAELAQLKQTVDDATKAGFAIRVAVITSPFDLGTLSALWEKPQPYCRFLSLEIAFAYKGRLLVVNPHGFGYVDRTQPQPAKLDLFRSIPLGKDPKEPARRGRCRGPAAGGRRGRTSCRRRRRTRPRHRRCRTP